MGFAENLKEELEFQNIQIKELSLKTGISKNTLDKYIFGNKSQPSAENAVKIAHVLGVTVEFLVTGIVADYPTSFAKLNTEQRRIISDYERLNPFNRKTIQDVLQSLLVRQ